MQRSSGELGAAGAQGEPGEPVQKNSFGMSIANGKLWLSEMPTQSFKGYDILK